MIHLLNHKRRSEPLPLIRDTEDPAPREKIPDVNSEVRPVLKLRADARFSLQEFLQPSNNCGNPFPLNEPWRIPGLVLVAAGNKREPAV